MRLYRDQNSPGGVVETETGVAGGSDCGPVTAGERGEVGGREVNLAPMVYSTTPLTKAHPEIQLATSTLCLLWFHKNIFNIQLAAFVG